MNKSPVFALLVLIFATQASAQSINSRSKYFTFNRMVLKSEVWINNGALFSKPDAVDVELEAMGDFDWLFADANGKIVRVVHHTKKYGGWTSVDLPSVGLFGSYKIGFRNASSQELIIRQGVVYSR